MTSVNSAEGSDSSSIEARPHPAPQLAGLTSGEAARRLTEHGPNLVHTFRLRWFHVLLRQLRSPLLMLLAATTALASLLGQRTDALIITVIMAASVLLGFVNEFRAERTAIDLHERMQHSCTVVRDGGALTIPVSNLVPGDVVVLTLGCVVPADGDLIDAAALACNESILTGESVPAEKSATHADVTERESESRNSVFMGTVVAAGSGRMLVTRTGADTSFGRMTVDLGLPQPLTGFQAGLQRFSMVLLAMAAALVTAVLLANVWVQHLWLEMFLFALAICVGITPQMLPAVVSISLAAGARRLAQSQVLVKRLISIEDLGDVEVLFTDKTGTLTLGELQFLRAIDTGGNHNDDLLFTALLATAADGHGCTWQPGANPLDASVWAAAATEATAARLVDYEQVAALPFDHDRQRSSRLVKSANRTELLVKGAAESVLPRCVDVPTTATEVLAGEYRLGNRVVALAQRTWTQLNDIHTDDERELHLLGFLVFADPVKESAADALQQLTNLGIRIKVLTGDHPLVAQRVCAQLGLPAQSAVTGADIDQLDDVSLAAAVERTTIFARLTPAQKVRIIRAQRATGADVAFLGDGVNDAAALHEADVGISVSNATDVAQDAAEVILLRKDLAVLATGVMRGRRVFTNTIKYVLMAASSNFGNMFSAAGASMFLPFLPMLPSQVLLNNLLYDASQLAICTDNADDEQLRRPSHWDMGLIRRYMLTFGLISSVFDFSTFAVLMWGFDAPPAQFRAGWFAESLATQTLVVLSIRTRRSPFWRSRPSFPLVFSVLAVVAVGALLPISPLADVLGLASLSWKQVLTLASLVGAYLTMVEVSKRLLAGRLPEPTQAPFKVRRPHRRIRRRLRRFTSHAGT